MRRYYSIIPYTIFVAGGLLGLFLIGRSNYLLFHGIIEFLSISIGVAVFAITWNSRHYLRNEYLRFIGYSAGFVAVLDMLHTLAYRGMGVFPGIGANLATQLWVGARYIHSVSYLLAPLFLLFSIPVFYSVSGLALVFTGLLLSIFLWDTFPAAFVEGVGLTPFKVGSEYVIIAIYVVALILLFTRRKNFDRQVFLLLAGSIAVSGMADLAFTLYISVYDWVNMLGHFFKAISYYFLYIAVVQTGIEQPYRLIFRELKASEETLRLSEAGLEEQVKARTRQLNEQHTLLETVLREAASGIIVVDAQGNITFANEAARSFIRRSEDHDAEADLEWGTIITPDGQQISPKQWFLPRALNGETMVGMEMRLTHPDGSVSDLIGSTSPLHSEGGSLNGTVIVLTDITQRRQAEEALRQLNAELEKRVHHRTAELAHELEERKQVEAALRLSQTRLRRLAESNIVGIITIQEDGSILAANDAVLEMIGYQRADLEQRRIRWDKITPPEFHEMDTRAYQEARATGVCSPYEKELLHKDGQRISISTGFAALDDSPGQYIAYVVDISAQKRAEEALARYAKRLEISNRELQDFAYVASHDLQEPLRKIIAFGDRLEQSAHKKLDETELDYVHRMQRAGERLRSMIDALLHLSRVTTQAQPIVSVDLNKVMEGVLNDLEVRIETSGAQVEVEPLPNAHADPLQMRQLLLNLTGNAIKFSRPGVPARVKISGEIIQNGKDRKLCLTVSDNGIGIEPQFYSRIFQPFQRLHGMGTYEGSGMGLAIVQKIVERHSGTVSVISQPGHGTAFTITLPDPTSVASAETAVISTE